MGRERGEAFLTPALDGAFRRGWQGPALLGSLRGVTAAEALVVPVGLRHGIWSITLHAAYWKYAVSLRLAAAGVRVEGVELGDGGRPREGFGRSPSNWPATPGRPDTRLWRGDVRLLSLWHARLIDAAGRLPERALDRVPPGGKSWTLRRMLLGAAAHDAYHCGQVQLIKRLVRSAARGGRAAPDILAR